MSTAASASPETGCAKRGEEMKPKTLSAKKLKQQVPIRGKLTNPKSAEDKQFDAIVDEILREHADVLRRLSKR